MKHGSLWLSNGVDWLSSAMRKFIWKLSLTFQLPITKWWLHLVHCQWIASEICFVSEIHSVCNWNCSNRRNISVLINIQLIDFVQLLILYKGLWNAKYLIWSVFTEWTKMSRSWNRRQEIHVKIGKANRGVEKLNSQMLIQNVLINNYMRWAIVPGFKARLERVDDSFLNWQIDRKISINFNKVPSSIYCQTLVITNESSTVPRCPFLGLLKLVDLIKDEVVLK